MTKSGLAKGTIRINLTESWYGGMYHFQRCPEENKPIAGACKNVRTRCGTTLKKAFIWQDLVGTMSSISTHMYCQRCVRGL